MFVYVHRALFKKIAETGSSDLKKEDALFSSSIQTGELPSGVSGLRVSLIIVLFPKIFYFEQSNGASARDTLGGSLPCRYNRTTPSFIVRFGS